MLIKKKEYYIIQNEPENKEEISMEELDLVELLELFWSKKVSIVVITLIAVIAGGVYSFYFVTPKYQSYTRLILSQVTDVQEDENTSTEGTSINQTDITLNKNLVSTYSEIIKGNTVLNQVISELGIDDSLESLKNSISVTDVDDTQIIKITVTNTDSTKAKDIANKIAEVFNVQVREMFNISNISVLDVAEESTVPYNINHIKDIVIFAFIGIVISVLYILLLNMFDNTVGSTKDIENEIGTIVLASIPECKKQGKEEKSTSKKGGKRYEK